uniref:Uncharacterized protein n=1 Tax=Anguilla anguilla TaxID=7936 RepID=A0A0E9SUP8_ANGAN
MTGPIVSVPHSATHLLVQALHVKEGLC